MKNEPCSAGGSAGNKLVEECQTLQKRPWIDKKKAKQAIALARRIARNRASRG